MTINAIQAKAEIGQLKSAFPALQQRVHNRPLIYLDNAATTQKPQIVINQLKHFYTFDNANVHRGVHELSQRATDNYEDARETIKSFINAPSSQEIVFVRGATEAINLVAHSFVAPRLKAGDEILITIMEHHSNLVPWQMLCKKVGATLKVAPINQRGELDLVKFKALLSKRTRLVALTHVSNILGTINPVKKICIWAHAKKIPVLIDGAQAVAHQKVDVQALGADFYVFSGHKLYGPTGVGVLYGRLALLEQMQPYQFGGEMISNVTLRQSTFQQSPAKFEAGTPNIAGAIGLGAAVSFLRQQDLKKIVDHEATLLRRATEELERIPGLSILGSAQHRSSVISFVIKDLHPHDIASVLDMAGIAVRAGHMCAQPLVSDLGTVAVTRVSFGLYNTFSDIELLASTLRKAIKLLKYGA